MSILIACYRLLLRLYPQPFREVFGTEMETVFQEQMIEAATHGRITLLWACWRELRDWPFHCFQAHWQMRQQQLATQSVEPPSWWTTAVASFPYFLLAIFLSGSTIFFLLGQAYSFFVAWLFSYGFVFILLLVLTVAWWRGWPIWSVTWLGFLFFVLLVFFLPGQLFNFLGQDAMTQPVLMIVIDIGFPLLWLTVLYVLLTRWPRTGLVAMLPTFGMAWFLYLEFVPEGVRMAVIAITWIWLGIIAIILLRRRHPIGDVWLLYLAAIIVGLLYVYTGHFLTEVQVRDGTAARMFDDLLTDLLPTLIPLVGILLLHTLQSWSWGHGRMAVVGHRLLLVGILFTLTGLQIALRLLIRQSNLSMLPLNLSIWLIAMLLLGCLLMLVGTGLIVKGERQGQLSVGWPIWLILGLLLALPLVFDVRWLATAYRQMGYSVGVVWLLLAGWVIGRVRPQLLLNKSEKTAVTTLLPQSDSITKREKFYFVTSLSLLGGLLLPLTTLATFFPNDQPQPFALQTAAPLFLVTTNALIIAARLLSSGFNLYQAGVRVTTVLFFVLSVILLVKAVYSLSSGTVLTTNLVIFGCLSPSWGSF